MPEHFDLTLDTERSGPDVFLPFGLTVPVPAVIVFKRAAHGNDVILRLEVVEDFWPTVTRVEIRTNDKTDSVTSSTLRAIKLGKMVRAASISLMLRSQELASWAPDTEPVGTGGTPLASALEAPGSSAIPLPDHQLFPLPPFQAGVKVQPPADPQWLARVKEDGPRSFAATQVTAALYTMAQDFGIPPNTHVAQVLELTRSTASYWIRAAREAQVLQASIRAKRGSADA